MRKRLMEILWIAAVLGILTGCKSKELGKLQEESQSVEMEEGREEFFAVVQDFSGVFLSFDEDGYLLDQALEEVGAYLEGEKDRGEAMDKVREILAVYQNKSENLEEFVLEDELAKQLGACGISAEEYKAFGGSRGNDLYNHMLSLTTLLEYLESAEELQESYEDLAFYYTVCKDEQESMRGYYYYGCLNYWFTWADKEERAYLDKQVIGRIKSYLPKDPVWYDSQEEVEEAVMGYLDEIEEIGGQMAKHAGENQEKLYQAEKDLHELQEKIEQKQALEEKLARLKEINARMEEINAEAAAAKEAGDEEKLSVLKEEFEALVAEYEEMGE